MRNAIAALVTVALVGTLAGASVAYASPSKSRSCSACHGSSSAVKVTVTKSASTSKRVTYKVKVTGGSGKAGWAAFVGGKNVARRTASTGTFSVATGKSVRVWGVKTGSGARSKSFTAKK